MDNNTNVPNNEQPAPAQSTPTQSAPTTPSTDNTTVMGVLAYLGPLVIVPYLTAKDNAFVRFHTRQGLVLFALEIAVWFIGMMMLPLYMILSFVNLGLIVLSIIGIVNVINKQEKEVPLVGQFSKHIPF